jgi:metal-responsive CopG/Arc/MetJ family transcriptional regulator
MDNDPGKIRVGFYIEKSLLKKCDAFLKTADARSRNEFVGTAIRWYIGYLSAQNSVDILPAALTAAVSATVQSSENRMARLLFKLAVEMSMMMNVVAAGADLDDISLRRLRGKCVDDVKKSIGAVNFDDVLRFQRGE